MFPTAPSWTLWAVAAAAAPIFMGLVMLIALSARPGVARGRELPGRAGLAGAVVVLAVAGLVALTVVAALERLVIRPVTRRAATPE